MRSNRAALLVGMLGEDPHPWPRVPARNRCIVDEPQMQDRVMQALAERRRRTNGSYPPPLRNIAV